MKLCPKCGQEKDLSDFHNEKKRKDGKQYWCKKCALKYRQDNAEKINAVLETDLGIDTEKFGISCMVAFGYRKTEPAIKTRQSLNEIVTWYS